MDDFIDLVDCINSTEYYGLDLLLYSICPLDARKYSFVVLEEDLRASAATVSEINVYQRTNHSSSGFEFSVWRDSSYHEASIAMLLPTSAWPSKR
jgi:hypothetical protein